MTTGPGSAIAGRGAARPFAVGNPVLFGLVAAMALATAAGGFVAVAPNRLVSGRAIALWACVPATLTGGLAASAAALLAAALATPRRALDRVALALAAAFFFLVLLALGSAARSLAAAAPAARISPGLAFWVLFAAAALAAADALQRLGAGSLARFGVAATLAGGGAAFASLGWFDRLSLAREFLSHREVFTAALGRHVVLVAVAVATAVAIGFPLGIGVVRRPRWQDPVFAVLNTLQTVPSIALFGLLIGPLAALATAVPALAAAGVAGIGPAPAIVALVLYALLPVVRNTSAGIAGVDAAIVDAARGIGMTPRQVLWRVELPLALPALLAGLRIVTVQAIGLAVVAALIGAGGLGSLVFEGLGQDAVDLVLLGALPAILLAFAADFLLLSLASLLPHRGVR